MSVRGVRLGADESALAVLLLPENHEQLGITLNPYYPNPQTMIAISFVLVLFRLLQCRCKETSAPAAEAMSLQPEP